MLSGASSGGEFQHQQAAARLQHAEHRAQRFVFVGDVAQAKGDGDAIEVIIRERQRFGVGLHVIDVADDATIAQLLASHLQHRIVDVRQHHLPLLADHAGELGRQVAGTAGQIQHALPAATPLQSMVKRFQIRWMPNDIRSFITSYFAATE